jgi:hypothetical protein
LVIEGQLVRARLTPLCTYTCMCSLFAWKHSFSRALTYFECLLVCECLRCLLSVCRVTAAVGSPEKVLERDVVARPEKGASETYCVESCVMRERPDWS